jgi:predicted secreted protein
VRALVVLFVALALAGTAAAAGPRIVGIGEQKDGENAKAHVGDTLVVTLGASRSAGSWKIGTVTRTVLRFDSSAYVAAKHPPLTPGVRGTAVLIFKVIARGKATLKLNYVSAGKIAKTFSVVIDAAPPGA